MVVVEYNYEKLPIQKLLKSVEKFLVELFHLCSRPTHFFLKDEFY